MVNISESRQTHPPPPSTNTPVFGHGFLKYSGRRNTSSHEPKVHQLSDQHRTQRHRTRYPTQVEYVRHESAPTGSTTHRTAVPGDTTTGLPWPNPASGTIAAQDSTRIGEPPGRRRMDGVGTCASSAPTKLRTKHIHGFPEFRHVQLPPKYTEINRSTLKTPVHHTTRATGLSIFTTAPATAITEAVQGAAASPRCQSR